MKSFLGYMPDFEFPDEAPPKELTSTYLVRRELRARPGQFLSSTVLAELTGLTTDRVGHALEVWRRRDRVVRRLSGTRVLKNAGQAYCWRDPETPG